MEDRSYQLTPRSGERLASADDLAQQANLLGLVVGHRLRETSFGRNAALRLSLSGLRRFVRQEFGEVAISHAPSVNGMTLTVPTMTLHLRGDTLVLRGPDGGGRQNFDLTGLPAGDYAVVLESWVSLVGATTLGQATQPAIYVGVTDGANKPDTTHFYEAGNIGGGGLSEAVLADTTLQTTKALQRQYRLTLIPDRDLDGYQSDLVPAGTTYEGPSMSINITDAGTPSTPLVWATVPEGPGAWDQAVDRRFLACKLAVVTSTGSALAVHVSDIRENDSFDHKGQAPAPVRLSRQDLEEWLSSRIAALSADVLAVETRLAIVESAQQATRVRSDEDQIVLPVNQDGSVIPQRLRFTQELSDPQHWHDPIAYPTRIQVDFSGTVQVNATVTYGAHTAAGLRIIRLLCNGIPTPFAQTAPGDANFDSSLTLIAELTVSAGDWLEIEPWQSTGSPLSVRQGAVLSVRRIA